MENYNNIKNHFHLICFAAGSPIFAIIATHIIGCKFSFIMNALSITKLTWALISFIGREDLGVTNTIKRLIISTMLISMCYFEMTNRQYFLDHTYMIGIDYFFTFIAPTKYYFQWINYYLKVGGILEKSYLIQTTLNAVAVWKTYDPTVEDRVLPFALDYIISIIYSAIFYIIQFYIIQKGVKLTPEPENTEKEVTKSAKKEKTDSNKKDENTETEEEKNKLDPNHKSKKVKTN